MKRILFASACALVLAACGRPAEFKTYADESLAGLTSEAAIAPPPASDAPRADIAVSIPMLAYAYSYGIEAPAAKVAGLVAGHEAACRAAGEAVCQITGSSLERDGERRVSGALSLRAQPAWLTSFRGGLAGEAEKAGGRLTRSDTDTEDLSTTIVDTEAAVRARTTLRDRLQTLLATRSGSLEDLLAVERELAQTQGEIDAAQSRLAMMRQRVATSALTIEYHSEGTLSEEGAWAPVAQAIRASQGVMASVVGGLILLIAGLVPLAIIGALGYVAFRRLWAKRRTRRAKTTDSTPAEP